MEVKPDLLRSTSRMMDDSSATTPAAPTTSFHIIGDSYVDYICILAASSSLPRVGEDIILPSPMTARAGGSPINTATHLTTLLQHERREDNDDSRFVGDRRASVAVPGQQRISIQTCFNPHDAMGRILMDHADEFQLVLVNDWLLVDVEDDSDDGDHRNRRSSSTKNTSTPHCIVMVTGSDRSFLTHRGCGVGWTVDATTSWPSDYGYLHIAGYYCTPEFAKDKRLAKLLRQYRQQQQQPKDIGKTIISLVTQYDATNQWDGGLVDDVIPLLDILIMNEVEANSVMEAYQNRKHNGVAAAATVTDKDKSIGIMDDNPLDKAIRMMKKWQQFYDQSGVIVVVTMGERGAVVFRNGIIQAHMEPPAIYVTDTTGAGDAFAAGFLYGHQISNGNIESALAWGCAMGSASVSVVGASVPVDISLIEHQRANLIQRS
jgi:sugar/nucleoside kinase (ribokinase family)